MTEHQIEELARNRCSDFCELPGSPCPDCIEWATEMRGEIVKAVCEELIEKIGERIEPVEIGNPLHRVENLINAGLGVALEIIRSFPNNQETTEPPTEDDLNKRVIERLRTHLDDVNTRQTFLEGDIADYKRQLKDLMERKSNIIHALIDLGDDLGGVEGL